MKFLLILGLCCPFILATLFENDQNEAKDQKSELEKLPDGPVHEIINHLDAKSKEHFTTSAREFLKFDTREVVLSLPLMKSKEPSEYVCHHLKMRKSLTIKFKWHVYDKRLFTPNSDARKYLECLSGIENLKLTTDSTILADPTFKIPELFPLLKHLEFNLADDVPLTAIPNNLKSLTLNYYVNQYQEKRKLKEKLKEMNQLENLTLRIVDFSKRGPSPLSPSISVLKDLPKFKRLSINFQGDEIKINDILAHTNDINYDVNLEANIHFDEGEFFNNLPKTIESLDLKVHVFVATDIFCNTLKTLNQLKVLKLEPDEIYGRYNCLLKSLPPSLTELSFTKDLKFSDDEEIILPKNLYSVSIREVTTKVFQLLANNVPVLETKISDHHNILKIQNPFTRVKILKYRNAYEKMNVEYWIHLLNLLPNQMDMVEFHPNLNSDRDFYQLEKNILSLEKRINRLKLEAFVILEEKHIKREYFYDGTKMIQKQ